MVVARSLLAVWDVGQPDGRLDRWTAVVVRPGMAVAGIAVADCGFGPTALSRLPVEQRPWHSLAAVGIGLGFPPGLEI